MERIALVPAPPRAYVALLLLGLLLPAAVVLGAAGHAHALLAPAIWVTLSVLVVVTLTLLSAMARGDLLLGPHGVEVRSTFFARSIAWCDLDADVQVVRRAATPDAALRLRTAGFGLPGLASGWFRTRGGERVLAWITADDLLRVPTRLGFTLLLSARDPGAARDALVARIRAAAEAPDQ